jgi:esterase/lipase
LVRAAVAINPLAPDPDQIDALEWHRSRGRTMIAVPVSPLEPWAYATLPIAALLAVHHGISNTDFAAITCPVLLVSSAADDVVDPASADVVAARLSNATVSRHVLARGGHVATLDVDADELNDVVVAFVDN